MYERSVLPVARWATLPRGGTARWRLIIIPILILSAIYLAFSRSNEHVITHSSVSYTDFSTPNVSLAVDEAEAFCSEHNFPPSPLRRRKVYDLFLLNTELDWLEVRLHTLSSTVDYFIIVEATFTFTGKNKPLLLKENWDRFKGFHGKIIHHVLEHPPKNPKTSWDTERYQRDAMYTQVFPTLKGGQRPEKGDVIVVSDLDEIPRPATIMVLRNCETPSQVTIRSQFYYYSFQWLHRGKQWAHGQATTFGGLEKGETILPTDLRRGAGNWRKYIRWGKTDIWNAGWHCSTCFENVSDVLQKMGAFSHVELNKEKFRDVKGIVDRIRHGKDLWDRKGEIYDRVDHNEDVPEYLKLDKKRWTYLLDRDGANAGFSDVK